MSSVLIDNDRRIWTRSASGAKPVVGTSTHHWGVVLAGGDGTRLQSLTHKIMGDSRPKQFCPIFNGQSLLAQTRARIESLFEDDRKLFVVTRAHEKFYSEELRYVDEPCILQQPLNRGTGIAMAFALLTILKRDSNAVVVFVPSDHYYSDVEAFERTLQIAISGAERNPKSIVLLGAEAHYPELEYGWIEPGPTLSHTPVHLLRVERFWEKPSLVKARSLLRRGCLWNTFVTVGHATTFLDLLCSESPDLVASMDCALACNGLDAAYVRLPIVDFSRQVLVPQPHRLLVVRDTASGWADLGSPDRVFDILTRNDIKPAWFREMQRESAQPSGFAIEASET
jgi:mannose-1-phosphate guanylyltransferase